MKLTIFPWHLEELAKKGYTTDQIVLLSWIHEKLDLTDFINCGSARVTALYQSLSRKGLITENGEELTTVGKELIIFVNTKNPRKVTKKKSVTTEFEEWWKAFPGTDTFVYNEIRFNGCRTLRQNKEKCRIKFDVIVLEGEYTPRKLIDALSFDVEKKKSMSVKTGVNKLTYLQNSLTYLNQRSYEPFLELIKSGAKVEKVPKIIGATDV